MSTSEDVLGFLEELDRMFEAAVMQPAQQGDEDLLSWGERLLVERHETARLDRAVPRSVRRAARSAVKLRRHWLDRSGEDAAADWRSRVDEALGGRAWLPGLQLAQWGLEAEPSHQLFEEVQERFGWCYLRPWMEGVDFEEYLAARREPGL
ncbi:MAG: hypothetical protein M3N51_01125 [Actinomycetota bacterium]|nr:hypothetical protein [Actinomycetota bacterium]